MFNEVFDRLKTVLDMIEATEGLSFAVSKRVGYVASSLDNLGLDVKVWLGLPALTKEGSDMSQAQAIAKSLGLDVQSFGGADGGAVEVTTTSRFGLSEAQTIQALYHGVKKLCLEEKGILEAARIQAHLTRIAQVRRSTART